MLLKWIRRRNPVMDRAIRDFLFNNGEIGHG
jgi:hypothetical protein